MDSLWNSYVPRNGAASADRSQSNHKKTSTQSSFDAVDRLWNSYEPKKAVSSAELIKARSAKTSKHFSFEHMDSLVNVYTPRKMASPSDTSKSRHKKTSTNCSFDDLDGLWDVYSPRILTSPSDVSGRMRRFLNKETTDLSSEETDSFSQWNPHSPRLLLSPDSESTALSHREDDSRFAFDELDMDLRPYTPNKLRQTPLGRPPISHQKKQQEINSGAASHTRIKSRPPLAESSAPSHTQKDANFMFEAMEDHLKAYASNKTHHSRSESAPCHRKKDTALSFEEMDSILRSYTPSKTRPANTDPAETSCGTEPCMEPPSQPVQHTVNPNTLPSMSMHSFPTIDAAVEPSAVSTAFPNSVGLNACPVALDRSTEPSLPHVEEASPIDLPLFEISGVPAVYTNYQNEELENLDLHMKQHSPQPPGRPSTKSNVCPNMTETNVCNLSETTQSKLTSSQQHLKHGVASDVSSFPELPTMIKSLPIFESSFHCSPSSRERSRSKGKQKPIQHRRTVSESPTQYTRIASLSKLCSTPTSSTIIHINKSPLKKQKKCDTEQTFVCSGSFLEHAPGSGVQQTRLSMSLGTQSEAECGIQERDNLKINTVSVGPCSVDSTQPIDEVAVQLTSNPPSAPSDVPAMQPRTNSLTSPKAAVERMLLRALQPAFAPTNQFCIIPSLQATSSSLLSTEQANNELNSQTTEQANNKQNESMKDSSIPLGASCRVGLEVESFDTPTPVPTMLPVFNPRRGQPKSQSNFKSQGLCGPSINVSSQSSQMPHVELLPEPSISSTLSLLPKASPSLFPSSTKNHRTIAASTALQPPGLNSNHSSSLVQSGAKIHTRTSSCPMVTASDTLSSQHNIQATAPCRKPTVEPEFWMETTVQETSIFLNKQLDKNRMSCPNPTKIKLSTGDAHPAMLPKNPPLPLRVGPRETLCNENPSQRIQNTSIPSHNAKDTTSSHSLANAPCNKSSQTSTSETSKHTIEPSDEEVVFPKLAPCLQPIITARPRVQTVVRAPVSATMQLKGSLPSQASVLNQPCAESNRKVDIAYAPSAMPIAEPRKCRSSNPSPLKRDKVPTFHFSVESNTNVDVAYAPSAMPIAEPRKCRSSNPSPLKCEKAPTFAESRKCRSSNPSPLKREKVPTFHSSELKPEFDPQNGPAPTCILA